MNRTRLEFAEQMGHLAEWWFNSPSILSECDSDNGLQEFALFLSTISGEVENLIYRFGAITIYDEKSLKEREKDWEEGLWEKLSTEEIEEVTNTDSSVAYDIRALGHQGQDVLVSLIHWAGKEEEVIELLAKKDQAIHFFDLGGKTYYVFHDDE